MSQMNLEYCSGGEWHQASGGTTVPLNAEDELRLVLKDAVRGRGCVVQAMNGGRFHQVAAETGSTLIPLGKAGRFRTGSLQIYLSGGSMATAMEEYQISVQSGASAPVPSPGMKKPGETGRDFRPVPPAPEPEEKKPELPGKGTDKFGMGLLQGTEEPGKKPEPAPTEREPAVRDPDPALQLSLEKMQRENQALRQQIEDMKEEQRTLSGLAGEGKSLGEKVEAQRKCNEELSRENDRLLKEYDRLQTDSRDAETATENSRKKLEEARQRQAEAEGELQELTRQAEDLEAERERIEKQIAETQAETERLKFAHTDAKLAEQELIRHRESLGMKDREISEAVEGLKKADAELKETEEKRQATETQLQDTRRRLEETQEEYDRIQERWKTREEEMATAEERLRQARKNLEKLDGEYQERMMEIRDRLTVYFEKRGEIDLDLKDIQESLQVVIMAAEDQRFAEYIRDLEDYMKRTDDLETALKTLKKEYRDAQTRMEKAQL